MTARPKWNDIAALGLAAGLVVVAPAAAYEVMQVADGGRISGQVRVTGELPSLPPQPVYKHQAECGATVRDDRLLVGAEGGLQNAVVTLDVAKGKSLPIASVVLDNRKCAFVPHVLSASVGQTLDIANGDPFLHDAHGWMGDETLFNLALPRGRTVHTRLDKAGLIHVNCNVRHTWMHAYVAVAEHPYHAVTDSSGGFTIPDVPPGRYRLMVWHELLGTSERQVTVAANQTETVMMSLSGVAPGTTAAK